MSRGMKKWAPYASLPEYEDFLNQMLLEREKVEKPLLFNDQIEQNYNILSNLSQDSEIILKYYKDGFIYKRKEKFIKLDIYSKKAYFSSLTIKFEDIIEIYD